MNLTVLLPQAGGDKGRIHTSNAGRGLTSGSLLRHNHEQKMIRGTTNTITRLTMNIYVRLTIFSFVTNHADRKTLIFSGSSWFKTYLHYFVRRDPKYAAQIIAYLTVNRGNHNIELLKRIIGALFNGLSNARQYELYRDMMLAPAYNITDVHSLGTGYFSVCKTFQGSSLFIATSTPEVLKLLLRQYGSLINVNDDNYAGLNCVMHRKKWKSLIILLDECHFDEGFDAYQIFRSLLARIPYIPTIERILSTRAFDKEMDSGVYLLSHAIAADRRPSVVAIILNDRRFAYRQILPLSFVRSMICISIEHCGRRMTRLLTSNEHIKSVITNDEYIIDILNNKGWNECIDSLIQS